MAALAVIGAVVWAGVAVAGTDGRCLSVRVDTEWSLPDGKVHPAGTLTLCDTKNHSPVATLHETYVDGFPVGMHMSARRVSEGDGTTRPMVMFLRDTEGRLHLFGYTVPTGDETITYVLARSRGVPRSDSSALARASTVARESLVLAAAKTH
jgi:hypothetical protein